MCDNTVLPSRRKPWRQPSFLQGRRDAVTLTLYRRERGFVTHPLRKSAVRSELARPMHLTLLLRVLVQGWAICSNSKAGPTVAEGQYG